MSYIQNKTSTYKSIKKDIKLLQLRDSGSTPKNHEMMPANQWLEKLKNALEA